MPNCMLLLACTNCLASLRWGSLVPPSAGDVPRRPSIVHTCVIPTRGLCAKISIPPCSSSLRVLSLAGGLTAVHPKSVRASFPRVFPGIWCKTSSVRYPDEQRAMLVSPRLAKSRAPAPPQG
ncbi:hypothetical protein FB451DRAFT_1289470 [Mycena latifolia]|nr:hypothetical protein FB451DRAFT_1289470 [Mycena latifolia]